MGHDVFISHSSKDKVAADAVCAALEANGVTCWMAPRDIKPGESWATSILRGIAGSRMMVLVFSAHTNNSQHIRREVERAVHRGIPIAPLRIQDAMPQDDLEYFLSSSHWIDALTPPLERHLREFTHRVRALLEMGGASPAPAPDLLAQPPRQTSPTHQPASRRRRSRVPALLLVLLLGAGATGWVFRGELRRLLSATSGGGPSAPESPGTYVPSTLPASPASVPTGSSPSRTPATVAVTPPPPVVAVTATPAAVNHAYDAANALRGEGVLASIKFEPGKVKEGMMKRRSCLDITDVIPGSPMEKIYGLKKGDQITQAGEYELQADTELDMAMVLDAYQKGEPITVVRAGNVIKLK